MTDFPDEPPRLPTRTYKAYSVRSNGMWITTVQGVPGHATSRNQHDAYVDTIEGMAERDDVPVTSVHLDITYEWDRNPTATTRPGFTFQHGALADLFLNVGAWLAQHHPDAQPEHITYSFWCGGEPEMGDDTHTLTLHIP